MSRFNTAQIASPKKARKTVNKAGGEAYDQSPKLKLVSLLLTSLLKDQFYRSANATASECIAAVDAVDPKFAAKAAIYARQVDGMRSISHLVAAHLASKVKGSKWMKEFLQFVVKRPDDVTEIVGCFMALYGQKPTNAMKKGLWRALSAFDAYQVAKYRQSGANLSLVDVVNLLHPPSTEPLTALVNGTLAPAETWEAKMTKAGQEGTEKKAVWATLVLERKIGYFALLRNLRNILQECQEEPEVLNAALSLLTDENLIRKSLVFPFRFLTAIDEIKKCGLPNTQRTIVALSKAMDLSLSNIPIFEGKTLIAVDCSGSMGWSTCGSVTTNRIAALFAAAIAKAQDADVLTFDGRAFYQTLNLMDSVSTIAESMQFRGGATDFNAIFRTANRAYDRIIILSDMQGWVGGYCPSRSFRDYRQNYRANPKIFSFDLSGYGSLQFPEQNVVALAGFSDKTLPLLKMLDQDQNALIKLIEEIDLTT